MNILHLKYAVEVARCGSINKAAEKLYVEPPNLSRAIKGLETSLGVTLFERSARGMVLTSDGEVFIRYAKNIMQQIDAVEELFSKGPVGKKRFSVSVTRTSYIADAFTSFSEKLDSDSRIELYYKETNSMRTIKNVISDDYKLGIIRYAENYDKYYTSMLDEKGIAYEIVAEFNYMLVARSDSPLAVKKKISYNDLEGYIEVAHADPFVPSLPFAEVKKEELPDNTSFRIFVYERASQLELLSENPKTFMWMAPTSESLLKRYGLVQRPCGENKRVYRDVLIRKKDYKLTELDNLFISELYKSKKKIFRNIH